MKLSVSYLWLALCLTLSNRAIASPQSDKEAAKVVAGWLAATPNPLAAAGNASLKPSTGQTTIFRNSSGDVIYYVVPLDPEGFVVTSPDSDVEPIVSFSAVGSFEPNLQNPLFAMLQRDLPERLAQVSGAVKMNTSALTPAQAKWARFAQDSGPVKQANGIPSVDDLRVSPFVQSRWNQSTIWNGSASVACYNYYTPPYVSGASSNYVCGCNNTAWAQIMRYYNYPTAGVGTNAFNITVDGVSTNRQLRGGDGLGGSYVWNSMTLVPGTSTTELQRQAIGALTADIGVAANTSYAPGGSGAWLSGGTLRSVFFYSNVIAGSGLGDQFANQALPNLDAKFPVYLSIYTDGYAVGHAIVCDGYGYNVGTLYHHLNLGWGGSSDAWYNLPTVDAGYHFTVVSGFYYNIYTNGAGEIISGRVMDTGNAPIPYCSVQADAGGQTYSTQGDSRGIFALPKLPSDTTFTVTVTKEGYQFSPRTVTTGHSQDYQNTGNRWAVNFIGTQNQNVRIISGSVTNSTGAGVSGVAVSFSNGGGTVSTDSSGLFFNTVSLGWSGTVTPTKIQNVFVPPSRSYTNLTTNLGSQDFLGTMVIYVSAFATGTNSGASWTEAYTNLQTALSQATAGSELWVAEGVYYPGRGRTNTFQCKSGVNLYGGFAGFETARSQRNWNAQVTELNGDVGVPGDKIDNVYHVVTGVSQSVLDGFKVTGGNANGDAWDDQCGGGITAPYSVADFTVANCQITGNSASNYAGGVSYVTVMNSIFTNNSASYGGAAYQASLVNCLIISNTASSYGGGAYYGTNLNCTLVRNSSGFYGGAAYQATLINCLVVSNTAASYGGGIMYGESFNCTVVGNWAHYYGGGIYGGSATNCIITGNLTDYGDPNYSSASLGYCCATPLLAGPGNLTNSPCFRDAANGDFRPGPESPAINMGLNQDWMAGAVDLAVQPRIANGIVDMGAYEIALTQPRLSCNVGSVALSLLTGTSTNNVFEIWNSGVGTLYYSLSTNVSWLSVTPAFGSSTGEHDGITISVTAAGLTPGNYSGLITFGSTNAIFTQQTLPVSLSVSPNYNPALDTTGMNWTSSGNAQWTAQTNVTHDGVDAAQSGLITHNQQSALQTSVNGPGTITFWWKVGSEGGWDKLHFEIGGSEKTNISGSVNWRQESFAVPAGPQTLRWTYIKDASVSVSPDAGWLDQVVFFGPPQLLNPTFNGTSFSLSVSTVTGKTYYLEYKSDLSDATWIPLSGIAGDGTMKVFTDSSATGPRKFYRVRVQ